VSGLAAQPSQLESTLQSLRYLDKITDEVKARVDDIMGNKCVAHLCPLCCCRRFNVCAIEHIQSIQS